MCIVSMNYVDKSDVEVYTCDVLDRKLILQ